MVVQVVTASSQGLVTTNIENVYSGRSGGNQINLTEVTLQVVLVLMKLMLLVLHMVMVEAEVEVQVITIQV